MNATMTTLDNPAIEMRPYNGEEYRPIKPQADSEALLKQGERVMLYHKSVGGGYCAVELHIAPRGLMCAGWAIGLIPNGGAL